MISDIEFEKITGLVKKHAGIHLSDAKRQLVVGRLSKRLRHLNLNSYSTYYEHCITCPKELQTMINTITTNETSFFREPHHFEFMRQNVLPYVKGGSFRVWSAAASIGAEGYSIAMTLDETFGQRRIEWEVLGTDINTEVVEQAAKGLYPMRFADQVNEQYLKKHCLKGVGPQDGQFLIDDFLRSKVKFKYANLMESIPSEFGKFDVIFLRNMLIYFDNENKKKIVENVLKNLKYGGHLFIGHAETIGHLDIDVTQVRPTIYRNVSNDR